MKRTITILLVLCLIMPVFAGCADSGAQESDPQEEVSEVVPEMSSEEPEPSVVLDDRGINGMNPQAIMLTLSSSFGVPYSKTDSDTPDDEVYSCVSMGDDPGTYSVYYSYSMGLDAESEIIEANFSVVAKDATGKELLLAADLFFYAISLISYDTADKDALAAWFEAALPEVSENPASVTIGDATFSLYGLDGYMYWVDICKAE